MMAAMAAAHTGVIAIPARDTCDPHQSGKGFVALCLLPGVCIGCFLWLLPPRTTLIPTSSRQKTRLHGCTASHPRRGTRNTRMGPKPESVGALARIGTWWKMPHGSVIHPVAQGHQTTAPWPLAASERYIGFNVVRLLIKFAVQIAIGYSAPVCTDWPSLQQRPTSS